MTLSKALACLATVATSIAAHAAPGDLDRSFGKDGIATARFGPSSESTRAVAVQPDGRIVLVGTLDGDTLAPRSSPPGRGGAFQV